MDRERLLIVGLDKPEIDAICDRVDYMTVAYEYLPKIKLVEGELFAESRNHGGRFLKIDRVVYRGIFENDFDFFTLLALWRGKCLPNAIGALDLRLRHSGLARVLSVTKFGKIPRSMAIEPDTWRSESTIVGKWGNWHCGENKVRFQGSWNSSEPTVFEPFIEGEAVRIVLMGDRYWQIRLTGDDWLKSIHHPDSSEISVDRELLEDTRTIAKHFNLEMVGVDYIVGNDGEKH
jgi:hypothetical protein